MKCLHCNDSKYVIKAGLRNTRQGTIQKYYCKTCGKYFTDKTQPHSQYPLHVILYTVESYNKGYTVKQAKKLTGKKYRYSPPTRTIYSWINRYQDILNMLKLRKKYNLDPEELLKTYRFQHQQIYPFTYHNLKLNLYSKKLPQLRRYINWIKRSLPTKIFLNGPRASSTEFKHNKKTKQKKSNITELTKLALTTSQKNKSAHGTIEQFFLINDSNTICTELPVFINPDETDIIKLDLPLTGHIDLVQIRYNKLYILDYKPNLRHPEQFSSQLLLYQKAIQKRTSIPEKNIIPAVFNQHHYFEFI